MFLVEITKHKGKISVSKIGKNVWGTAVSIYNNMSILRDNGYITLIRRKNTVIPELTKLGIITVDAYLSDMDTLQL